MKKLRFLFAAIIMATAALFSLAGCKEAHTCVGEKWEVNKEATCTEDGKKSFICSCGKVVETEIIPALGHSYGEDGMLSISSDGNTATLKNKCENCEEIKSEPYSGKYVRSNDAYLFENGSRVNIDEQTFEYEGKDYYVINNVIQTNYVVIIENRVYCFGDDGVMQDKTYNNEEITVGGNIYYVINNVIRKNVYIRIENNIYYYGSDGVKASTPVNGEVTAGENTYYVINNVIQKNVYIRIENNIYYYGADGAKDSTATNGKVTADENTYYITDNVIQVNVYVNIDDKIYYFGIDGKMIAGGSNGSYNFGADGAMTGSGIYITIGEILYEVNGGIATVHSHNYTEKVVAPTCTEDGYTEYNCSCGDSYTAEPTSALGHDEKIHEAKAATCAEVGWETYVTCSRCDYSTYVEKPALGHDEKIHEEKDPTCTEVGWETYVTCSRCDYTTYVEKPALGHEYINGVCEICGAKKSSEGLYYTLNSDSQSYSVSGIGSCKDTSILIPSTYNEKPVTGIASSAFKNCTAITSIVIPDSVTSIGLCAFSGCSSMESITIPFVGNRAGVTSSDTYQYPFGYIFGDSSYIGNSATGQDYYGSSTSNTTYSTYYIPSSLRSVTVTGGNILRGAFSDCGILTSITIPDSVTSIGDYAFEHCVSLTSITIPDKVTSIGERAFYECRRLTSIAIPDTVSIIGRSAFNNTEYYNNSSNWTDGVLYIGKHLIKAKDSISGAYTVKSGTKCIAGDAFYGCGSLTSIIIPDTAKSIGDYSFYSCYNLKSITLGKGVESIGKYAFYECSRLTSLIIPGTATSIGKWAFQYCSSLTSITIPDKVTSIGEGAFNNCGNLTSATLGKGVTSIGIWAFYNCSNLTSITISDRVTSIGEDAFYNTAYYNNDSNWTDGVLYIGNHLIEAKTYILGAYTVKFGTRCIADWAFHNCSNLTSITISDRVTSIGEGAFYNCKSLTSITIPDTVTSIGEEAFENCAALTSVTIGNSVRSIGVRAFRLCKSLTKIKFNGTKAEWKAINKGIYWSAYTGKYTVYCTDGNISKADDN